MEKNMEVTMYIIQGIESRGQGPNNCCTWFRQIVKSGCIIALGKVCESSATLVSPTPNIQTPHLCHISITQFSS